MRADHQGPFRSAYEKNRRAIIKSQDVCAICGRPVDKSLKAPNPWSPTVDHIIPVSKGGHPSDMGNLQLAHWICNRYKSDKVAIPIIDTHHAIKEPIRQTVDWSRF